MPHFTLDEITKMSGESFREEYYDKIKDKAEEVLGTYKNIIRKKENKQIDKKLAKEMAYRIAASYANLLKGEKHLDFKGDFTDEDSFKNLSLEDRMRIIETLKMHLGFDIDSLRMSLEGRKIPDHLKFLSEYADEIVDFAKKSHHQKNAGYLVEHLKTDRDATLKGVDKRLPADYKIDPEAKGTITEDKVYEILKLGKDKNLTPKVAKDQLKYLVQYSGKG